MPGEKEGSVWALLFPSDRRTLWQGSVPAARIPGGGFFNRFHPFAEATFDGGQ